MKPKWPCILILVLLCGCSAVKDPETLANSVKEGYAASSLIETDAVIEADTSEERTEYKVHVSYSNDQASRAEISVLAPESIAGITATYEADSGTLTYADTTLETLLPNRSGLTPVDAVPAILHSLIAEDPSSVWTEGEVLVLQYQDEQDACTAVREVYLNQSDGSLESARVFCNGTQIISCTFSGFSIQT